MSEPQSSASKDNSVDEEGAEGSLRLARAGLFLGPLVLLFWLLSAPTYSLTPEAHRLAGIMLLTILWWITEPIPIAATALAAVVLCAMLGAVPPNEKGQYETARSLLAPFGEPSVFFLLGGLFIGLAMARHGLDRRLALSILRSRWAGRSPGTVLAAVGFGVAIISMWISNTAATAMMYPVTLGMIAVFSTGGQTDGKPFARSRYASGLLLMTAYASSVGGIATPIGTATNMVAMGYFRQPAYFGQPIDFLRWTMLGIPMMLCIFVGMFLWMRFLAPAEQVDMPALRDYLQRSYADLGPWKRGEINTLIVFGILVTLWVTPGILALFASTAAQQAFSRRFPEEVMALLAPVVLYLLPTDWKHGKFTLEASDFRRIDWSTVILFGSALSLGNLMFKTGLAQVTGQRLFDWLGTDNVWLITAMAIASGIVLSEFTSNASAAATMIPVVLTLCNQAGVDPRPPLLGVAFGASFGSALPVSTPPNAIVYSSGLLPVRRMVVAGIGVDLVAGIVIWIVLRIGFGLDWTPFG